MKRQFATALSRLLKALQASRFHTIPEAEHLAHALLASQALSVSKLNG
jgi:hypothetical protein